MFSAKYGGSISVPEECKLTCKVGEDRRTCMFKWLERTVKTKRENRPKKVAKLFNKPKFRAIFDAYLAKCAMYEVTIGEKRNCPQACRDELQLDMSKLRSKQLV